MQPSCVCRLYSFRQLPDHILLRIFRDIEAIPKGTAEQDGHGGPRYQDVTDDTLTVLTDGHQRRSGLPLVCKQWHKLLSQPSFVWADLNIGFHELWFLQQVSCVLLTHMSLLIAYKICHCAAAS